MSDIGLPANFALVVTLALGAVAFLAAALIAGIVALTRRIRTRAARISAYFLVAAIASAILAYLSDDHFFEYNSVWPDRLTLAYLAGWIVTAVLAVRIR